MKIKAKREGHALAFGVLCESCRNWIIARVELPPAVNFAISFLAKQFELDREVAGTYHCVDCMIGGSHGSEIVQDSEADPEIPFDTASGNGRRLAGSVEIEAEQQPDSDATGLSPFRLEAMGGDDSGSNGEGVPDTDSDGIGTE